MSKRQSKALKKGAKKSRPGERRTGIGAARKPYEPQIGGAGALPPALLEGVQEVGHLGDLVPDPANCRKHTPRNVGAIVSSLQSVGFGRSIVIDEDNTVLAGNATVDACGEAGIERVRIIEASGHEVIAVRRRGLTPAQKAQLAISDNRTAELADWDAEQLLKTIAEYELDLSGIEFTEQEIAAIQMSAEGKREVVEDEVPEAGGAGIETRCKPGDLWRLGDHRLLCGDSTNAEDVGRLMNGERAGLMNTDPPYGVGYANDERPNPGVAKPRVAKPRVANDKLADEELQRFLETCFGLAATSALKPNAAWYMWHADLTQGYFAAAAAAANVVLHRQIIWVKPVLLLGRGQYHWKHEPCFMGWIEGNQPPDYGEGNGERTQTTVWEIDSVSQADRKEFNHSTPKPVGLFKIPIVKHLGPGEIAYEPFAGSGPQFIAAEQLGRRCYGIELEPKFCDVILARWEKLTGKTAEKIG